MNFSKLVILSLVLFSTNYASQKTVSVVSDEHEQSLDTTIGYKRLREEIDHMLLNYVGIDVDKMNEEQYKKYLEYHAIEAVFVGVSEELADDINIAEDYKIWNEYLDIKIKDLIKKRDEQVKSKVNRFEQKKHHKFCGKQNEEMKLVNENYKKRRLVKRSDREISKLQNIKDLITRSKAQALAIHTYAQTIKLDLYRMKTKPYSEWRKIIDQELKSYDKIGLHGLDEIKRAKYLEMLAVRVVLTGKSEDLPVHVNMAKDYEDWNEDLDIRIQEFEHKITKLELEITKLESPTKTGVGIIGRKNQIERMQKRLTELQDIKKVITECPVQAQAIHELAENIRALKQGKEKKKQSDDELEQPASATATKIAEVTVIKAPTFRSAYAPAKTTESQSKKRVMLCRAKEKKDDIEWLEGIRQELENYEEVDLNELDEINYSRYLELHAIRALLLGRSEELPATMNITEDYKYWREYLEINIGLHNKDIQASLISEEDINCSKMKINELERIKNLLTKRPTVQACAIHDYIQNCRERAVRFKEQRKVDYLKWLGDIDQELKDSFEKVDLSELLQVKKARYFELHALKAVLTGKSEMLPVDINIEEDYKTWHDYVDKRLKMSKERTESTSKAGGHNNNCKHKSKANAIGRMLKRVDELEKIKQLITERPNVQAQIIHDFVGGIREYLEKMTQDAKKRQYKKKCIELRRNKSSLRQAHKTEPDSAVPSKIDAANKAEGTTSKSPVLTSTPVFVPATQQPKEKVAAVVQPTVKEQLLDEKATKSSVTYVLSEDNRKWIKDINQELGEVFSGEDLYEFGNIKYARYLELKAVRAVLVAQSEVLPEDINIAEDYKVWDASLDRYIKQNRDMSNKSNKLRGTGASRFLNRVDELEKIKKLITERPNIQSFAVHNLANLFRQENGYRESRKIS